MKYKKQIIYVFLTFAFFSNCFCNIVLSNIEETLHYALSNSELNQVKTEKTLQQMKNSKLSITEFLPELNFSFNEYDNIKLHGNDIRTKSLSATLTQLIFDNGKTKLNYIYKKSQSTFAYLENKKYIQEFCLLVQEKYYNCILQNMLLELNIQLLENAKVELAQEEYKYSSGISIKSDLLEYQIYVKELENQIAKSIQQKEKFYSELKSLLNVNQNCIIILPDNIQLLYSKDKLMQNYTNIENIILSSDIQLQQTQNNLYFQTKQNRIINQHYFPSIYLNGGINFSGKSYPLTQPDYSLTLTFKFESLPFFPTGVSNNTGFQNNKLNTLANSLSTSFKPEVSYFSSKKISKLNLQQAQIEFSKELSDAKMNIKNLINEHDNQIDYINLLTESLLLKKDKFEILTLQLKQGTIKTSDYFSEKIKLSETEQKLLKSKIELIIAQEKIKYLTQGAFH